MVQYLKRFFQPFLILALLLLSGCASPVYKYFTPVAVSNADAPKPCLYPEVKSISNINNSLQQYYREGYVQIGQSSWDDEASDIQSDLLKKSKEINACLVLVYRKQTGTETEEMPSSVYMSPGFGYYPGYYGGGFETYQPYMVSLYQYNVFFLKQMENFYTGLYITDLDDQSRKAIQSNKGVVVALVVNNSPAYNADIIPGDIIIQVGKFILTNTDSFNNAVEFYQGQNVIFTLYRNGNKLNKSITVSSAKY